MPHFLWVEDFKASETERGDNIIASTINLVFGSILKNQDYDDEYDARDLLEEQGIFLKLNLLEALEFIHNPEELAKVDFIVLDVDMPLKRDSQPDNNNYLPDLITAYQSESELKKIAGYQIYIDLVIELGFPKNHILFCSNHAGYFKEFTQKFASSNIKFPELLQKEHNEKIKNWLTEAHSDYFVLRRGIIQGCQFLKNLMQQDEHSIQFRDFIKQTGHEIANTDLQNYLDTLALFLPLKEEPGQSNIQCRLFLRTLAHEWEENLSPESFKDKYAGDLSKIHDIYTFAWLMKMTRNWVSHANLLEPLDPQFIAFLFLVNMRAMFKLPKQIQPYEAILLSCINKTPVTSLDINNIRQEMRYANDDINQLLRADEKTPFGHKLNVLYRQNTGNPDAEEHNFKRFLMQYFFINQEAYLGALVSKSSDFLPTLARHIYSRSFLSGE